MVGEKFAVRLMPEERNQLEHMVRTGKGSARVINRARILLKTARAALRQVRTTQGGPSSWPNALSTSSGALLRAGWTVCSRTGPTVPQDG